MFKKLHFYSFLLFMCLGIILSGCKEEDKITEQLKSEEEFNIDTSSPIKTLESFISIYHFDKGTYNNYENLFAGKEKIREEGEFKEFRESTKPEDVFSTGSKSIDETLSHIKVAEIDENNAKVYWVENAQEDEEEKAKFYWLVTKKDGKWLLN
ncbi:hypothetical protein [Bacillus sp. AK031]